MTDINPEDEHDSIIQTNRHNAMPQEVTLNCESVGIVRTKPRSPNFTSRESRIHSYTNWPEQHPLCPDELADAGFFYQGVSDSVQCFHCGGGLRTWDPTDDVWVQHAVWFAKCAYLLLEKGSDFVATVQSIDNDVISYDDVLRRMRDFIPPSPLKAIEEFCKLNVQHQLNMKCMLCSEKQTGVIFLPCSHYICCTDCSVSLMSCPQCDVMIEKTVKAYLCN